MEFLTPFYNEPSDLISISADQGATFAQDIAGDFNPIHYPDSKRFCVPGDLLFSIALSKYGLHQEMQFEFLDMVKAGVHLRYPDALNDGKAMVSYAVDGAAEGKSVLAVTATGNRSLEANNVEGLIKKYVAFSGHNFPHILQPLMQTNNVMINPSRPLVIYQSMSFSLDRLDFKTLQINLDSASMEIDGKRGDAVLKFAFTDNGSTIGAGEKKLVLSGLRPYDGEIMDGLVQEYMTRANSREGES